MTELQRKRSKGETMSILLGAAFLMATSAIGPGFITQTTVFTERLKAAFAFAIVVSVLVDIVVQLNVWLSCHICLTILENTYRCLLFYIS